MKPHLLFSLCALLAFCPGTPAAPQYDTAAERYLNADLNTALGDEAFFQSLQHSWMEDIRISREPNRNPMIEDLSDSEMDAALRTVEAYLKAVRTAYGAQMDFARHSLSIVQESAPELYSATLERYRCALQHLYGRDLQILRAVSPLVADAPSANIGEADDFIAAINHRANISAWGGLAYREFCGSAGSIAQQQLEMKQKYVADIISHERDEIFLCPELLSNYSGSDSKPDDYYSESKEKFEAAEKAWADYSRIAAQLLHPGGLWEGQGSGICMMFLRLDLMKIHEKYYTLLLYGLAPK